VGGVGGEKGEKTERKKGKRNKGKRQNLVGPDCVIISTTNAIGINSEKKRKKKTSWKAQPARGPFTNTKQKLEKRGGSSEGSKR